MADAGLRLVVEGEKEFKESLKSIDAQLKINKSELKLLTEEYNLNAQGIKTIAGSTDDLEGNLKSLSGGMETLVTKQKALAEAVVLHEEKVRDLDEMYRKASEAYGENDAKVQSLKKSLLDASTELTKTTAEYDKNMRAIEDQSKALEDAKQALEDSKNGTAALDKQLEELDAQLSANKAELSALSAEYKNGIKQSGDFAAQEASLKKQNDTLNESIEAQRKKIETLNEKMQQAAKRYGDQSKEVSDYRKQIAEATGDLQEMTKQVEDNAKALEDTGKSGGGLRDVLGEISEMTGVKIPEGITEMIGGFGGAAAAAGAVAAALGTAVETLKQGAASADDLITKSAISGISVETLQELEFLAPLVDTSVDDIVNALEKLKKGMYEAQQGNDEWVKKFKQLGVQIEDTNGNLLDAYDVFKELVKRYESVDNATERSALMQQVFGQSAKNLIPLVNAGSEALEYYSQMAHDLGYVIDSSAINSLGKLQNKFDVVSKAMDGAKMNLSNFLLTLAGGFTGMSSWKDVKDAGKGLWDSVTGWIKSALLPSSQYANGTSYHQGGLALVGERGPEIVDLPAGSKVYPNGKYPAMSENNVYNITISAADVREFNDIVRIAQSQRVSARMGYIGG